MSILKDGSFQHGEMRFAVVAVQILSVISGITVDIVNTTTERTHISAVILNLDNEVNGRLLRGKPFMKNKNSHSSSPLT